MKCTVLFSGCTEHKLRVLLSEEINAFHLVVLLKYHRHSGCFCPRTSAVAQTSTFCFKVWELKWAEPSSLQCGRNYIKRECRPLIRLICLIHACFCSKRQVRVKTKQTKEKNKRWVTEWVSGWAIIRAIEWVIQQECEPGDWSADRLTDSETADWSSEWLMSRWSFTGS